MQAAQDGILDASIIQFLQKRMGERLVQVFEDNQRGCKKTSVPSRNEKKRVSCTHKATQIQTQTDGSLLSCQLFPFAFITKVFF